MKILVSFYSKTGNNKKAAEVLAKLAKADLEEIVDAKKRTGAWGLITAGIDGAFKSKAGIKTTKFDPQVYDLVIALTPIWAGGIAPAMRTYLTQNKEKFKKIAFVSICGMGEKNQNAVADFANICGQKPVASLLISQPDFEHGKHEEKLKEFLDRLI